MSLWGYISSENMLPFLVTTLNLLQGMFVVLDVKKIIPTRLANSTECSDLNF
jgi:hypothetical protein